MTDTSVVNPTAVSELIHLKDELRTWRDRLIYLEQQVNEAKEALKDVREAYETGQKELKAWIDMTVSPPMALPLFGLADPQGNPSESIR